MKNMVFYRFEGKNIKRFQSKMNRRFNYFKNTSLQVTYTFAPFRHIVNFKMWLINNGKFLDSKEECIKK